MAEMGTDIKIIRTVDNVEHYIDAKKWDGHEWGELASAFKYCGITSTKLEDGATTNPVVIGGTNHTATAGCVVFYNDKEFVFNGTNWELLGGELTYKVVQQPVEALPDPSGSATAFIDSIKQDANGVITVTKKYLGKQYRLEYTATESLGDLSPCNISSVLHEYDSVTGKGVFIYSDAPTSVEDEAFDSCSSLASVTIPDSVTTIGTRAFFGCSSLTSVTIPNSVTTIGFGAFSDCSSITSITIPNSVTDIGNSAFFGCTGELIINSKIIEDNYESKPRWLIGANFTKLTIGDSVTAIGNFVFNNCSNFTSITIPDSVTTIGNSAFSGCTGELIINSKIVETDYTSYNYPSYHGWLKEAKFTKLTIGDSVTTIGNYAFSNCNSLTSATIPNSVTTIGDYVFRLCTSLTSVTIGDSVTTIEIYAFLGCSSLTSVTIPDSVTTIENFAFQGCSSLTSVTIPDSVTDIGSHAFEYCTSLTSVTIPDSVTDIGNYAFDGCSSLTSVTIPDSVTSIGSYAFEYCTSLTSVTIGDSVTSIGDKAFRYCSSLTSVYCKATTPPVGGYDMFYDNTSDRKIYVPDRSVDNYRGDEEWGVYAIEGCVFENDFILVLLNDEIDNIVNSYFILSGSMSGSGSGEGISMALDDESSDIYEEEPIE